MGLLVTLEVDPDRVDEFLAAIGTQQAASLGEPGCLRFDVVRDRTAPATFHLYEVYADDTALAAHRATPHYAGWRSVSSRLVSGRSVREGDLLDLG